MARLGLRCRIKLCAAMKVAAGARALIVRHAAKHHERSASACRHGVQPQHGDGEIADVDGGAGCLGAPRHFEMVEVADSVYLLTKHKYTRPATSMWSRSPPASAC